MRLTTNFVFLSLGALFAMMPAALVAADGPPQGGQWGPPNPGPPNPGPPNPGPPKDGKDGKDGWPGDKHPPPPPPGQSGYPGKPPYGGGKDDGSKWGGHPPRPTDTQVLWGQCGGFYYKGTTQCPKGAYCRKFSDWYSQCNLNNQ